jgi:hypothetical protein
MYFREGPNAHWTTELKDATKFTTAHEAQETSHRWTDGHGQVEYHFDEVRFATDIIGRAYACRFVVTAIDRDKNVTLDIVEADGGRRLAVISLDELHTLLDKGLFHETAIVPYRQN